jgi:hypothetical protein
MLTLFISIIILRIRKSSIPFRLSQALGNTNVDYLDIPEEGQGGQLPSSLPLARAVLHRLGVPQQQQWQQAAPQASG